MADEFYTIVDDNGTFQIRASIRTPEQMLAFIVQLEKTAVELTNRTKEKTSE